MAIARTPFLEHIPLTVIQSPSGGRWCALYGESPPAERFSRSGAKLTVAGAPGVDKKLTPLPATADPNAMEAATAASAAAEISLPTSASWASARLLISGNLCENAL